jgi:GntR family transcriptional regulator/MocR family aminotransferase
MIPPVPQALLDAPLSRERGPASLQRQLHDRLKQAILGAHLAPGSRLPGSRALAEALAISRNTVTTVYDLLAAEGYLLPDRQGTRVAALTRAAPARTARSANQRVTTHPVARRLAPIRTESARTDGDAALRPGVPALAQFPLAEWRRALDRVMRGAGPSVLGYGDPLGEPALRRAIARHLSVARGVRCEAAQVIVTEGAMEALALCARLLTNPGDTAWVEDPGYRGARTAMHAADLLIVPMRVDAEGLCVRDSDWAARPPRLIYATPSHQYPSGAVMSAARRLELIANAQRHGAWIIEDDYDSEFRHAGEPIGAMQGLVAQAPVLYVGTFSKTMFPSLRLGFLVLPEALATRLQAPLEQLLRGGHRHEQLALGEFIEGGAFVRHLGRMRRLYRQRQAALREALSRHLRVPHAIDGGHCGLHLTVRLPGAQPDTAIAAAALRHGMAPAALSSFAMQASVGDNGLVLGYGNTPAERFEPLVKRLSQLARQTAC